jgi:hypothetical protein
VSPPDQDGFKYIHVIKLMPSRVVGLYPSKDLSAESLALALFQFFITFGVVDVLVTDPGSNINSEVAFGLVRGTIKDFIGASSREQRCREKCGSFCPCWWGMSVWQTNGQSLM